MSEKVAIVGIGQTEHTFLRPDANAEEMVNEAVRRALQDAHLTIKDIDAVAIGNMELFEGHYLADGIIVDGAGMLLKSGFKMSTGGTTGGTTVAAGWHHIASGLFGTTLVIAWEKQDAAPSVSAIMTAREPFYDRNFASGAAGTFAAKAIEYMHNTGCKEEHAAIDRVIMADNARRNPYAHLKMDLTVEKVLDSRVLVWPVRLLHLSPTSCGACALILANEKRAKEITKKPVWITDIEVTHQDNSSSRGGGVTLVPSKSSMDIASAKLYKRNGITNPARDIDVWELYTPCSWTRFLWMEWFHICEQGQAWKLIEKEAIRIEGEIPMEPSGGVVSTNAIGSSGVQRVAEAALQVRGDAGEHQVPKDVKRALATAFGGNYWIEIFYLTKTLL